MSIVCVQITPEFGPRESEDSSTSGDSKCLTADAPTQTQSGVLSVRPASAPLPQLPDRQHVDDVSFTR